MTIFARAVSALAVAIAISAPIAGAADFTFFGRSGDGIEINLGAIPGVSPGSIFASLNTSGFSGHTILTSDTLSAQSFSTSGRFWVFANPARNTPALGDTNSAARGFQGTLNGSVSVNGLTKTFSVVVQPSYTGSGGGAVGQSNESLGDATNNPLYVAQQQQRLRYLGFVRQGGAAVTVTGTFDAATDEATRTFQGAFTSGPGNFNTTQESGGAVDGIIGPNTAGWLNAANASSWDELIDPDPQPPGTFSTSTMIGNFDIYPGPDPGTGDRTGNTPQPERFGTSWEIDVIKKGSALAKATTGRTQRINAMSRSDGYASSCCHNTHRVGMDIDLYTNSSTWNYGNGVRSTEEQIVINHAQSFINAAASGAVVRFITSNQDIYDGIAALNPTVALYYDTSGGHQNHLHIDIGSPIRAAGLANLAGDFNLDDVVDARDYVIWRSGLNKTYTQSQLAIWRSNFGKSVIGRPMNLSFAAAGSVGSMTIPEPATLISILSLLCLCQTVRFRCR
jgi:hypothetical protein